MHIYHVYAMKCLPAMHIFEASCAQASWTTAAFAWCESSRPGIIGGEGATDGTRRPENDFERFQVSMQQMIEALPA